MGALILAGSQIRERDEQLCLTDMWRAAGSDENKRPVIWMRHDGPRDFITYMAGELEVTEDHLVQTEKGGRDGGSTWAHWEVSIYYAKYLSHEFHSQCNKIIRAHFEKRSSGGLSKQIEDMLFDTHRHVVETHSIAVATHDRVVETHGNVTYLMDKGRKPATLETVRIQGKAIWHHWYGKCPCNECETVIMVDGEFIDGAWHHHHQFNKNDNRPEAMIPLAVDCHRRIEQDAAARTRFSAGAWVEFQNVLKRMRPKQIAMDLRMPGS